MTAGEAVTNFLFNYPTLVRGRRLRLASPCAAMDMLKGAALIAAFIGFLTIFALWVSLWDNVWRVSVEPTGASIYLA